MDLSKTLEQLEESDWGNPDEGPTGMVRRCLEARRVPLAELSAEDCRLLLGQKIGVPFIVPVALKFLYDNPMEGGDMLPGTLLRYVLEQPDSFWQTNSALWWEVKEILFEVEILREQVERLVPFAKRFEAINVD